MASALVAGAAAMMDQVQNIGQIAELGQNVVHQREQIRWSRKSYELDAQSVRLDALDHAKEEIRSHYDTYVNQIDTLLVVLALIFPFALNTIQFSDPFIPQTSTDCPACVEVEFTFLVTLWACLIAVILIMPFWGILMLLRCKTKLDRWLEVALSGLHCERREIVSMSHHYHDIDNDDTQDTNRVVYKLVNVVLRYQEYLAKIWREECGPLVQHATVLLWLSSTCALILSAESIWMWLVNQGDAHLKAARYFAVIVCVGILGPAVYLGMRSVYGDVQAPRDAYDADEVDGLNDEDDTEEVSSSGKSSRFSSENEPDQSVSCAEGLLHRVPAWRRTGRSLCPRRSQIAPTLSQGLLECREAAGWPPNGQRRAS